MLKLEGGFEVQGLLPDSVQVQLDFITFFVSGCDVVPVSRGYGDVTADILDAECRGPGLEIYPVVRIHAKLEEPVGSSADDYLVLIAVTLQEYPGLQCYFGEGRGSLQKTGYGYGIVFTIQVQRIVVETRTKLGVTLWAFNHGPIKLVRTGIFGYCTGAFVEVPVA